MSYSQCIIKLLNLYNTCLTIKNLKHGTLNFKNLNKICFGTFKNHVIDKVFDFKILEEQTSIN